MLRRLVLAAIAAGVTLCASDAGADQSVHRIGVLYGGFPADTTKAWLQGLRERGWVVGGNLQIEYRYFHGRYEKIPALAAELAVLINHTNPMNERLQPELPDIGRQLGVTLVVVEASEPDQLETAFDAAIKQGAEAIQIWDDPLTFGRSAAIVALAARYRLPASYFFRKNVWDGGLMSFGPDPADRLWRAGAYVDKILKGERPADLAVGQPIGYQLVANLKTAAALGITVPRLILAEASEVIE